jgi:4-amino-4-deoxy-L-arabinose transferase-like glycosyltransferase
MWDRDTEVALGPNPVGGNTFRFAPLALILLCGLFFCYGLNSGELYRTESLRAIIAAEVLRSGNWIVPRLYGEPLFTKPPGMYAAIAVVSWPLGGVTEWSARLPSAIAASVIVVLFYFLFRRHLGPQAGLIAAAVIPLSLIMLDKAPSAEIDMLQVAWVTAAIFCFVRALEQEEEGDRLGARCARPRAIWGWWLGALLCVAGGVLTKWTAPVFFYGTAAPLLWWRGRLRLLWSLPHLVSAAVGAGLCLTWAASAIALEGWDVFSFEVTRQASTHILPTHHHRPYPWLESLGHPVRIWVAALPISAFALPALTGRFFRLWDERERLLLQVMHCWIWPNLIFWSLAPAHNTRHSLPLYPGIAGLAAFVWIAWIRGKLPWRWPRLAPAKALCALLAAGLIAKIIFVHYVTPDRLRGRDPRKKGEMLAALVPEGATLHLFRLKDEGIMFYYGRPAQRLRETENLPSAGEPLYCILRQSEWREFPRQTHVLKHMTDEQGDPVVLVRVVPAEAGKE